MSLTYSEIWVLDKNVYEKFFATYLGVVEKVDARRGGGGGADADAGGVVVVVATPAQHRKQREVDKSFEEWGI